MIAMVFAAIVLTAIALALIVFAAIVFFIVFATQNIDVYVFGYDSG